MTKNVRRLLLYIGGLFILALGINISKVAGLGISPVTSIPYAVELIWGIELGKATMMVYLVFVVLQIVILRKQYEIIQLLQIVFTYILSFFITYTGTSYILAWMPLPSTYIVRLIYLLFSIVVIGIGISLYLISDFIPLPGEGLINSIVEFSNDKLKFGNVKSAVDCILVLISATLSLIYLGQLKSVREGTVLAALLVGRVIGFIFENHKEKVINWIEE